jgi:hypothetical protein
MAYQRSQSDDPFDYDKTPSLSWRDLPVGTVFTLEVLDAAKALQTTNFETGEPAFWNNDESRPKMAAVINVTVLEGPHSMGEARSIWAQIPSNLFMALKEAQDVAKTRFAPGGILRLRFAGEKKHDNPRFNPIKQYEARYEPPVSQEGPDPFIQEPPAPQGVQPSTGASQGWGQTTAGPVPSRALPTSTPPPGTRKAW